MNAPPVGLLAAIYSEYIRPEQWIAWADDQIIKTTKPPMWLIDLSLANNTTEAWRAIGESIKKTAELPSRELDEAALGLIAMRYFEGSIGLREFLLAAGNHTDASGCSIDCEYFYNHLNRYEASEDPSTYEAQAASDIQTRLKKAIGFAEVAKVQIKSITEPQR